MPTYTNNIPQPADNPATSQDQILQNFQVLDTAFTQDHGSYNAPNQGQHKQITFPVGPLTGQPFAYLVGQIGLQSLNQAPTARPDIWMSRGTGTAFPITGYSIGAGGYSGWTYLPSGCLMAWGLGTISAGGQVIITYATVNTSGGAGVNFPGFNSLGNPLCTWTGAPAGTAVSVGTVTITTFTAFSEGAINGSFIWHAVGF